MGRPFIVDVNLSDIQNDQGETHYTMYIDDTKMTVVYELIEWIKWIFSLNHCVYLTHDNSVIHELEDIKILSVLKNVRVHNCGHQCVHTKLNHLFKKLNFFVQWDGIKVPKLFLNKVKEITKKLVQKEGDAKVIMNDYSKEETRPNEEGKVEVNKIKELHLGNVNTCENQLSENLNSNVCASSKVNFNRNSNSKLDDTAVNNFNEVHSVSFAKSEIVNLYNNNTTNFNTNSNIKLNDTSVGMSNSNKMHSVLSEKYDYAHMNNVNKTNSMGRGLKLCDTATGLNNSNKVHSVPSDENEFVNAPVKIGNCKIEKIKSLVDINHSGHTEFNECEEINKSNRKRFQSISDDKKINDKIIKKVPKPFSVGELLANLRSEINTSSTDHEINTSVEQNRNCLLSNGLINDRMEYIDQNLPNNSDGTVTITKRKRQRQRRHRPRRLMSRASKLDNFLPLPKPEGDIPGAVKLYTPSYTKQSSHIRFTSDDEDFSDANDSKSDKQSEKTQHDVSKNNELVENGMEQCSLINEEEETVPMAQQNACDENNESKADNFLEANKEFINLDKLVYLHDQKSSSGNLFEYSNEKNQQTNGESKTSDNYDFNLSTLKALKEKFPSPMVVERFY